MNHANHIWRYFTVLSTFVFTISGVLSCNLICDFNCMFRIGDVQLGITSPLPDSLVTTDNFGFIEVSGNSYAVHEQTCPQEETTFGEVFLFVTAPPDVQLFNQGHIYPTAKGDWTLRAHLGATVPESGEEYILTAICVGKEYIEVLEQENSFPSWSALKEIAPQLVIAEPVKIMVR